MAEKEELRRREMREGERSWAGKAFMKQLGDEVLKFVVRVEYKSPGDNSVHVQNARFEKFHDNQCMYRSRDELGRDMIFASYV